MKGRTGTYRTRTGGAIRGALLALLAEKPLAQVSVAELSRAAGVSRSTFYEHYGTPADVFEELVDETESDMSSLMGQVACSDGFRPAGKPFCSLVRDAGEHAPIVRDPQFMDTFLTRDDSVESHDLYTLLVDAGYTGTQARALCSFQMSGCFNAARSARVPDEEWPDVRSVIDRFILGGIAACLAAKRD